jgi:hypothetical protein
MNQKELVSEILAIYWKHGWRLRQVLLRPETRVEFFPREEEFEGVAIEEAKIDALWFSRPSYEKREAWELRLLSETQYALFQTFAADKSEVQRRALRQEMEERMEKYIAGNPGQIK